MQRKQKSAATIGYHEAINILPGYHPAESERRSQGKASPHKTIPLPAASSVSGSTGDHPYGILKNGQSCHPPNPGAPRRALSQARAWLPSAAYIERVRGSSLSSFFSILLPGIFVCSAMPQASRSRRHTISTRPAPSCCNSSFPGWGTLRISMSRERSWRAFSASCYTSGICQSIGSDPASVRSRLTCEKHRHPKNFLADKGEGCAVAITVWCDCMINARFF